MCTGHAMKICIHIETQVMHKERILTDEMHGWEEIHACKEHNYVGKTMRVRKNKETISSHQIYVLPSHDCEDISYMFHCCLYATMDVPLVRHTVYSWSRIKRDLDTARLTLYTVNKLFIHM